MIPEYDTESYRLFFESFKHKPDEQCFEFGVHIEKDDKSLSKTRSLIAERYGTLPRLEKDDNMIHLFGDEQRPEGFRNFEDAKRQSLLDQIEICAALYMMNTPYSKMVIKLTDHGVRIRLKK